MDETLEQQIITSLTSIKLEEEPTIIALQINEILAKVLSYLPLKDLKNTRQVNQLWKDESKKYFKNRALVDFSTPDFLFRLDYKKDFMETNKCHVNFKICDSIRKMLGSDNTDFNLLASTLKSIQHLEELDLQIYLRKDADSKEDWMKDFALLEPFSHLKKFKLRLTCWWKFGGYDWLILKKFFRKLLQLTPNLNVLCLSSFRSRHAKLYLEEMVKMEVEWEPAESKGPKPFQNLSSFEIDVNLVEQLMKLSQPIRKLSISNKDGGLETFSLRELLKKHAKTLESFEFKFSKSEFQNLGPFWNIDFPKLQRIRFKVKKPKSLYRILRQQEQTNLEFEMFKMGVEKFTEKFPSLRSFTWIDESETFLSRIYEIILPQPNPDVEFCFPQITSFDIWKSSRLEDTDEEHDEWMNRLTKMFPNVHNPKFNRARDSQSISVISDIEQLSLLFID